MRSVKIGCTITFQLALALAIAVAQTPATNDGNAVVRPFHMTGELTFIDMTNGFPMTLIDRGFASHMGTFFNVGKYTSPTDGFGIYRASNGDQIFWRQGAADEIQFTGGTGRFQKASGSFKFTMSPGQYVAGPNGTLSYVAVYKAEGRIRY